MSQNKSLKGNLFLIHHFIFKMFLIIKKESVIIETTRQELSCILYHRAGPPSFFFGDSPQTILEDLLEPGFVLCEGCPRSDDTLVYRTLVSWPPEYHKGIKEKSSNQDHYYQKQYSRKSRTHKIVSCIDLPTNHHFNPLNNSVGIGISSLISMIEINPSRINNLSRG